MSAILYLFPDQFSRRAESMEESLLRLLPRVHPQIGEYLAFGLRMDSARRHGPFFAERRSRIGIQV